MATCSVCGSEHGDGDQCMVCRWSAGSELCSTCGTALGPGGTCPSCERERLLELEIDAFTGPAIRRARIWMVVLGIAYVVNGAWASFRVADARDVIAHDRALIDEALRAQQRRLDARPHDFHARIDSDANRLIAEALPDFDPRTQVDRMEARVDTASTLAVLTILIGAAALVVAAWAKRKTMTACYAIVAVFGAHTVLSLAIGGIAVLADPVWLVFLVGVIMAFLAGRKAERLRASGTHAL